MQVSVGTWYAVEVQPVGVQRARVIAELHSLGKLQVEVPALYDTKRVVRPQDVLRPWAEHEAELNAQARARQLQDDERRNELAEVKGRLNRVRDTLEMAGLVLLSKELRNALTARTLLTGGHRVSLEALEEVAARLTAVSMT